MPSSERPVADAPAAAPGQPADAAITASPRALKIDFVSDVVCPWCAIGLAALEQAITRLGDAVTVAIGFQPFELNPQLPPEGEDATEHLMRKYGMPLAQVEANREAIRARGAALGFEFRMDRRSRVVNTFDAHRLLHWAAIEGRQRALKQVLLTAYFRDGADVSDHATLARLAGAAGLDAGAARSVLAAATYAAEVRARERFYTELGIRAVPSVIVDERHLIQGGQPVEAFEAALRQLAGLA
ncbi:MAG: DsbA family oxidoreductase [Xanthomonadaceae bacterium]|nr:DsbA family oxidoreductase [Xanthomonadaceae bacterium]MDE2178092.1 DsbA family oxidoreductase [Xanthomonadaceae bacterium]